ncbi:MAG: hypothetical protein ACK5JT_02295, partial [Hyphomicrobiaceae bacterium]
MAAAGNDDTLWLVVPAGETAQGSWIDDTLRERAHENGLLARTPLAGQFPRQRVEAITGADAAERAQRLYRLRGWTDGLPVVLPTTARVKAMLAFTDGRATDSLGDVEPLKGIATREKVAANAVMAGCRADFFPVVLAAVAAALDPAFNMRGVQTTDENAAPLIVVNGPIAKALGINSSFGALGPGWHGNASIGRALRLVMNNIGGGWPGCVSFAGLGHAGRYTMCLAEDEAKTPWLPLHVQQGLARETSAVTLFRAETAINVTGGLDEIASVMGSAASAFQIMWSGIATVIMSPATANLLHAKGLSKDDAADWLWRHGRWPTDQWKRSWHYQLVEGLERWGDWVHASAADGAVQPTAKPEDITIVVAGGDIPIAQHVYCPSWGFPPARITRPIALPDDWDTLHAETV